MASEEEPFAGRERPRKSRRQEQIATFTNVTTKRDDAAIATLTLVDRGRKNPWRKRNDVEMTTRKTVREV